MNTTLETRAPPELVAAFREMCRENEWTTEEVLEHLLEYAVEQDYHLALDIHKLRRRKYRNEKWEHPHPDGLD